MFIKIGKVLGWILFGLVMLVVAFYLVLLAINWRDQPPSRAALEFQAFYENRTKIEDADNAYVYLMGFDVPKKESPKEWGVKRIAWTHEVDKSALAETVMEFPGPSNDLGSMRSSELAELIANCRTPDKHCINSLAINKTIIAEWNTSESWMLERYREFIAHSGWYEAADLDINLPLPLYGSVMEAQRHYLIDLWIQAGSGNVDGLRDFLHQDLIFWRKVQKDSEILISKMIAAMAIRNHYFWTNRILSRLSAEEVGKVVSPVLSAAMDGDDLSMYRVFVGEWIFSKSLFVASDGSFNDFSDFDYLPEFIPESLTSRIFEPLFQPQDSLNKHSEALKNIAENFAIPLHQYPEAREKAETTFNQDADLTVLLSEPYNFSGNLLMAISSGQYNDYVVRVSDLEGARRALVLITQMRSQSVSIEDAEAFISQSDLRNPYTNEAFEWDEELSAVVFVGLTPNELGTYLFEY